MDTDVRRPLREGTQRPYAIRLDSRGTMRCRQCGGTDWVEVWDERVGPEAFTPTVKPCQCHPGYERWTKGWPRVEGAKHSQPEFIPTRSPRPTQQQF